MVAAKGVEGLRDNDEDLSPRVSPVTSPYS